MGVVFWTLVTILVSLLTYVYFWMQKKYRYWEERGVPYEKPLPFFGNMLPVATFRLSLNEFYNDFYTRFPNAKVVGLYEAVDPVLIVQDPNLLEKILVKDFQHFTDHPPFGNEEGIFANGLFNLKGRQWRSIRYKISPTFTTGKLKAMFDQIDVCGNEMMANLHKNKTDCTMRVYLSEYSLAVVASTVFGVEIKEGKMVEDFFKHSRLIFYSGLYYYAQQMFLTLFPKVGQKLGFKFFPPEVENFFKNLITETFDQREKSNVQRNDYLNHLIKLKKQGYVEILDKEADDNYLSLEDHEGTEKIDISEDILMGQAMQFLIAGFDPLINVSLYVLFELSQNQEVQDKVRNEIKESMSRNGGFTYGAIRDLTYLEQCIYETLRVHSLGAVLQRVCTKSYTTPDGLEIEKGTRIMVPLKAMNLDPQYFPDPDKFDPNRFASDKQVPSIFIPFGSGPRICIGMRFAIVQMKVSLAKILMNFNLTLSPKTKLPLELNTLSFAPLLKSDILFNLTPVRQ